MSIGKILNSLENSWERDDILLKIKNGLGTDEIVNEFLIKNEEQIKELKTLLSTENINFLNQAEQLISCEAKLMNKINNLNYLKNIENNHKKNEENISLNKIVPTHKFTILIMNWSNKFVLIALLTISAIALSKQAWA